MTDKTREVLDGIKTRHLNSRGSTNRAERAQYRDDHGALVVAVEAVLELADYWERTPALRKGTAASNVRAAIEKALNP